MPQEHLALLLKNSLNNKQAIELLKELRPSYFSKEKNAYAYFSDTVIEAILEEEDKHEIPLLSNRKLITHSSGERKKLLIHHILKDIPRLIILENPLDHLDKTSRTAFIDQLQQISKHTRLIQLTSRASDFLPFIEKRFQLNEEGALEPYSVSKSNLKAFDLENSTTPTDDDQELVRMEHININYDGRPIIKNLNWTIKSGEFWQLSGPNGSGKSSLLALITGDNTKGYGQELYLFGRKKGSGESVWEIKKKIGYFAPSMTTLFSRSNTLLEMVLSGYYDSVGLYDKPTSFQLQEAKLWLERANLLSVQHKNFLKLTQGQQRLGLILRAVVKDPSLIILDEPTDGLDDGAAELVIDLINKLKDYSRAGIVFVSHRNEVGLEPQSLLELTPSKDGSTATIKYL